MFIMNLELVNWLLTSYNQDPGFQDESRRFGEFGGMVNIYRDAEPIVGIDYGALADVALGLGATGATVIDSGLISVEDELAALCGETKCRNYGLSASCPPHVGGPAEFRRLVGTMKKALVFKIDLPSEILLSSDRREVALLVNEIAVAVEKAALDMGASSARSFTGGSCKQLYCREKPDCRVVDGNGSCRNPDLARPSMSGYGINVGKLMGSAGWIMWEKKEDMSGGRGTMGTMAALVLIG